MEEGRGRHSLHLTTLLELLLPALPHEGEFQAPFLASMFAPPEAKGIGVSMSQCCQEAWEAVTCSL